MVIGRSPGLTSAMYLCGKQASHISLFFKAFVSLDTSLSIEHECLSASLTLPYPIIYLFSIVVPDYLVLHGFWPAVASSCCASPSPAAHFNGMEQQVLTFLLISPKNQLFVALILFIGGGCFCFIDLALSLIISCSLLFCVSFLLLLF